MDLHCILSWSQDLCPPPADKFLYWFANQSLIWRHSWRQSVAAWRQSLGVGGKAGNAGRAGRKRAPMAANRAVQISSVSSVQLFVARWNRLRWAVRCWGSISSHLCHRGDTAAKAAAKLAQTMAA
eukprot:gene16492-biopygen3743